MNASQINTAIVTGSFTNQDLNAIADAIKFARSRLAQATKWSLKVGERVQFTSTKTGITMTGTVSKIAIKYVTVATQQGLWRVPANMLSKVETA